MLGTVLLTGFLSVSALQVAAAAPATVLQYSNPAARLTESQKVTQLINYIRNLEGAAFIRNGTEYTCKAAADHLQAKWRKHRTRVRTAGNFIEALASASGMTGEPYLIRFPDGTVVETKQVLLQELKRLEQL